MMLSSNQRSSSSQAATTGFPFITFDGMRAAKSRYDYIVVGGGTAGCPLAATLSTKYSVLVVERGGSPYGNPDIENADAYGKVLLEADKYTSPAQKFESEDTKCSGENVTLHRARVLGGGTAINAGFYSRASSEYVSNMGWDRRLVEESYKWVENQILREPRQLSPWSDDIKKGLREAGVVPDNGHTLDHLEGTKTSASIFDSNGKRHTAADLLNSANATNIVVLLYATVTKVLFNETQDRPPRARGVEIMCGVDQRYEVFLNELSCSSESKITLEEKGKFPEVILTAGALGSPQLLLLSGIGPSEHLSNFNIPLVLHLPWVGKRIQDNPIASVTCKSHNFYAQQVVGITPRNYFEAPSIFVKSSPDGRNEYNISIFEKLASPLSRGELLLVGTDPRDNPSVRYNYYKDDDNLDFERGKQGMRVIAQLLKTPSLQNSSASCFHGLQLDESNDAAMAQICRDTLSTVWHFHGGCEVGYVVNSRYQVKGVDNLRIVDESTYRDSPGSNPQATTMMLGRYVGVKILQERAG